MRALAELIGAQRRSFESADAEGSLLVTGPEFDGSGRMQTMPTNDTTRSRAVILRRSSGPSDRARFSYFMLIVTQHFAHA